MRLFLVVAVVLIVAKAGASVNLSVVPGLGEMEAEGGPGARVGAQATQPSTLPPNWEGNGVVDAAWNRQYLAEQSQKMLEAKKRELEAAIAAKKAQIASLKERQEEEEFMKELRIQTIGERPIDDLGHDEKEVFDGYKSNPELLDPKAAPECIDSVNPDLPMTAVNERAPPKLEKVFAAPPATRPPYEAIRPVVTYPINPTLGERDALDISSTASDVDVATGMDKRDYQTWSLAVGSVKDGAVFKTSQAGRAVSSAGPDVVGLAKDAASSVLSRAFGQGGEVANPEGGLDMSTAWGVMNAKGEAALGPEVYLPAEETLYTRSPSPSPSPSNAPREVYLQQENLVRELYDPAFAEQSLLSHSNIMAERDNDEEDVAIDIQQPVLSRINRTFLGKLPHPVTMEAATPSGELVGMGVQKSDVHSKRELEGSMLVQQSAAKMMTVPELSRFRHHQKESK